MLPAICAPVCSVRLDDCGLWSTVGLYPGSQAWILLLRLLSAMRLFPFGILILFLVLQSCVINTIKAVRYSDVLARFHCTVMLYTLY